MSKKSDKDLLATAKKRYDIVQEGWDNFYREARDTLKFISGHQWDDQLRNNRENAGIPCLTSNVLPGYLRQITNEARQNCPSIQIDPRSEGSSQDNAELLADLIRGIEQSSDAHTAYDNACYYAAAIGIGYFRVVSEYENENSFDQKLVIKAIDDPETVWMDPNHRAIDGSDCEYVFIITTLTKEEYLRQFSTTKLAKDVEANGWSTDTNKWLREDEVVIAEYYYKDYTEVTLYQVFNTVTGETIESTEKPPQELVNDGTLMIINSRPTSECTIKWAKLNDTEILEETTWPGKYIPVVAVKGDELWIQGKREVKGAVIDAIDSQRAFNYFFSLQAELLALAPKAPYIGDVRQFANYEHLWRDANVAPSAYLPYNAIVENGQMLPPPQRQTAEVPIQAAMQLCAQARDNIKAVFGIFDAAMGAQGNETSGVAILARTHQSHTTTYHFYDNLVKAVSQCGKILIEAIPTYYANDREVQLIKQNGESSSSRINNTEDNSVTDGQFGVVVETGPSFATRRQDSMAHMLAFAATDPQVMPLIGDLIAENSDWPGAKRIAARLRTMLPPAIQQEEMTNNSGVDPKQQLAQMSQQFQAMQQQMQVLQQQHQEADGLLHAAMSENKLLKEKSALELMKANNDNSIKEKQLALDEAEMEVSFKIKMQELKLQERQMKLNEAKIAIEGATVMNDMNNDAHDHHIAHVTAMKISNPSASDFNDGMPEGLDKSFSTVGGKDITNA